MYVYVLIHIRRYFVRTWHMQLWRLESPKSAVLTSRQRLRRADIADKVKHNLLENFHLLEETTIFVLFRSLHDWMGPIHNMKSNLLTSLNVNLIEKTYSNSTYEINHQSGHSYFYLIKYYPLSIHHSPPAWLEIFFIKLVFATVKYTFAASIHLDWTSLVAQW